MAFTIFRVLNNSLILICVFSLFTKCEANEFTDYEEKGFNEFVQGGLLRHISKSIAGWDNGNLVNCVQDLAAWSQGFTSVEAWALKMLDAGGRPPHGLLEGNINSVGMFEECLGISHQMNNSRIIKGKYCLARLPLPLSILGRNEMLSMSPKAVMGGTLQNNQRIMNSGPKGYYFNLAVCFPAYCKASFVETTLAAAFAASNISLSIELPAEYCYADDPKPWDAGEIVALVVLVLIGVLLVWGTIYDVYYQVKKTVDHQYQNNPLMAFSVYTNSKRLTTLSKDPGPLACIHGIRVLSICWIILGHRHVESISFPVENLSDMISWSTSYAAMTIVASTVSVDTFFLLSGILLSYIFFRRTDNKSLRDIPMMYLHRFLRLTPVMVIVMLIQITFTAKLGRGPFWRQLNVGINDCKDYWWSMILYVQNYVNPENMCLAQTWYLSVDMQLYILSPLLLFPILKHVKIGMAWIGTWILAALITVFTLSYIKEWAAANNSDPSVMDRTINYYYATHTRASPWLIGLLAGYYLRIFNLKEIKINKILVGVLWIASLAVMAAVLYGMKPLSESTHLFTYLEDTTYLAFSRPAWALAVLWVIVACALGYGGPVNWFLSLRLWEFLARLSYSMYLIHIIIINFFVSSTKTIPYFSHETLVHHFFGDLLITIVVSYFMVLAFESPVTVLEKYIFGKDTKKPTSQENLVLDPEQMKRTQENPNV